MHMQTSSKGGKKSQNFELNLVPFIDVLSTCICFLLVTAVFINLGSIPVNQAVGSQAQSEKQKKSGSVTVSFGDKGDLRFEVKDVASVRGAQGTVTIAGVNGQVDLSRAERWIQTFAAQQPDVKTVLMMPNPMSKYDDLIQLMAQFKKSQMDQIGIAPL